MTETTRRVLEMLLRVFRENPERMVYGLEITESTDLLPGTTYPILQRLLDRDWVVDTWEDVDPVAVKRPRRRLYRLTPSGAVAAESALRTAAERRTRRRTLPSAGPAVESG